MAGQLEGEVPPRLATRVRLIVMNPRHTTPWFYVDFRVKTLDQNGNEFHIGLLPQVRSERAGRRSVGLQGAILYRTMMNYVLKMMTFAFK